MINTSETRIIFNGNGVATDFPYSFKIINDTDVKVMTVDPDSTETVLDSGYYVDVTASKVVYPGYPPGEEPAESERPPVLPTGWQLVVYRDIPITQEADLGDRWPFNVIESALDKITMILQNIYDGFKRSLKVGQNAPANIDIVVPIEANKALKWNADGTQIVLTVDPADVLPQAQTLLQQTTEQANIATNKANAAADSAVSAATSEMNAGQSEDNAAASELMAEKWAQSAESPDGETDTDSPTGDTMSAKEWALYAKQLALQIGNPVVDVTESNGTVSIKKADNTSNEFNIVKTVNGITPINGDVNLNRKFYNSLAQLGLNYDTVTFDQIANTLPVNSTLTFYVDIVTSQPTYAPNLDIPVSGFIVVTKGSNNTVPIKFTLSPIANNATTYLGEYTTYNSYGFKGWQPVVMSVNGAKPNISGNVTMAVDTYTEWKWTDGYTVIDGFTVKFPNGYKQCVWYLYFPSGYSAMNINFPEAFSAPPCVFGSIVVANDSTHLTANVYNVTATSCRCVTNNSGNTVTYWVAMGYDKLIRTVIKNDPNRR